MPKPPLPVYGKPKPDEVTLTLPVPPSANDYWRYTGRVYTSEAAKAYKQAIEYEVNCDKLEGEVAISVSVFRGAKRGDLDNFLKIMLDALQSKVYENDSHIVEIHAYRFDDKDNPRVEFLAWNPEPYERGARSSEMSLDSDPTASVDAQTNMAGRAKRMTPTTALSRTSSGSMPGSQTNATAFQSRMMTTLHAYSTRKNGAGSSGKSR